MIGTLNTVNVATSGLLDQEAENWFAEVSSAGGLVNRRTLESASKFVTSLKRLGIRNKIARCNLFCGSNLAAALVPIIKSTSEGGKTLGNSADTNVGFVSADYDKASGLTPNGTSLAVQAVKYLETGLYLTSAGVRNDATSGHVSFMSASTDVDSSLAGGYMMPIHGGDYFNPQELSAYIEFHSSGWLYAASPSTYVPVNKGYVEIEDEKNIGGFWLANRASSTDQRLYQNGIRMDDGSGNVDQSASLTGGYKFRIFAAYNGNEDRSIQTSIYKLLFYSVGRGLTEDDIKNLGDLLKKFNTSEGRS